MLRFSRNNIDFALLLSYWKKRISTTLQVYTAKFILEASVSKRNPQRRQDIVDSALLETYHVRAAQKSIWCTWFSSFIMFLNVIKSFIHCYCSLLLVKYVI